MADFTQAELDDFDDWDNFDDFFGDEAVDLEEDEY